MKKQKLSKFLLFINLICFVLILPSLVLADVHRVKYQGGGSYLVVEVLDDDLLHFEFGRGSGASINNMLDTTPMVYKTDYSGPTEFTNNGSGILETKDVRLEINTNNLFITIIDKTKHNLLLTTLTPLNLDHDWKGLTATRSKEMGIYGLGQQFLEPGKSDINWDGNVREGGDFGNIMASFNGGFNGNTQIPIMYAVNGATFENYALFIDNKYKQMWDFTGYSQWKVEMLGDQIRFYVMTGPDLQDLRKDYMELVGRPPVPPRKMFGLWVSEYGYDNWAELESKLNTLHSNKFPVDGFVLDLQWFGGVKACSDDTRMGSLSWDTGNFPNPSQKISDLKNNKGIGIMTIEEAYVGRALPEHSDLNNRGCLVKDHVGGSAPAYLTTNCWWGKGGMIDYTSDSCSDYWHDLKRQPLINNGIIAHWTDLGEPEMYNPGAGYAGGNHSDIHNIFNFEWHHGIYDGYVRNHVERRPFMMSRSGAAGIQRFGAAMWSGDIASRLSSLAAHAANQANMSFSGIDYYGADIGGFHRNLEGDLNEMYTQWYAYGMMFDIPGRPHTENLCNCRETAPDRIGDFASNLENTRLRYELIPYVYSLAYRAYLYGEPLIPPLVLYYQSDNNVRNMGHEKLIGRDLLAAIVAKHGEVARDVYLPAGIWIDYHTNQRINSIGQWITAVPEYRNGKFKLPLYAREGAIIPMLFVDEKTMNALNKRSDSNVHNELIAKVFAGEKESDFTLYEDDGETTAYQRGEARTTKISQKRTGNSVAVTVHDSSGAYANAPTSRNSLIRLVVDNPATNVTLNGVVLTKHASKADFDSADSGWINSENKTILSKSGIMPVDSAKKFVFTLSDALSCTSKYRTISVPGAGNGWNPVDPGRTLSCEGGLLWKGRVTMSNEQYKFAADGSWSVNWGSDGKRDGPNFPSIAAGIYDVSFDENDPANPDFKLVEIPYGISAKFICDNGYTTFGTSVYVVGNIPELGNWKAENAVKLNPDGPYPRWTGIINNLPVNTHIEWKCVKRLESGGSVLQWEPGNNNVFTSPASGSAGEQPGAF